MADDVVIAGVPRGIMRDAWWLGDEAPRPGARPPELAAQGRGFALLALLATADVLFWRQVPGVSLAVFAAAVLAAAAWGVPQRRLAGPVVLLAIGALPVMDHVQALSVAFLATSLAGAVVLARGPDNGLGSVTSRAARLLASLPFAGVRAGLRGLGGAVRRPRVTGRRRILRDWAFPVGGTLVFAALLMEANPVLARVLSLRLDVSELAERGLFWLGVALMVWPFLAPLSEAQGLRMPKAGALPRFGINAASTLRALVMFNLLIGLQTLTDLSIFWGGADLPRGMSHAAYAHRGAYPLLATALLAGGFALAARPFLSEHRLIRPLMLVWLAQNVALCLSALLRLDLYVAVYGLTYLRLHSFIWIGLVAAGLAMTGWQAARDRSNTWLLARCIGMGLAVLYLSCFVNFAGIIAAQNLTLPEPDVDYVCALGPTASAAIVASGRSDLWLPSRCAEAPVIRGWRDWGFRNWRIARYLAATPREVTHGHPDRG